MKVLIHNTIDRAKETLEPKGTEFKMYCCGPTVYGPAHIGNFRTFLVQDALRRTLEASGIKVKHVRNITDVDDKTIRESQKLGITLKEFTQKWTDKFHADCKKLNMLAPTVEPKATEHIGEQIKMVKTLVEKGHAYAMPDGSVYFKISSFPKYGKLSGLDTSSLSTQSENSAGNANLADEYERDSVSDFALWKGRKPEDGENSWKSPWGEGRPGWHIECSAMSAKYLGPSFDLHGGGIDLCFPHHENEIAQSECASGVKPYVRYWFHSAHLMVEGKKMSKSLGNLYTLDDLEGKGYTPMQVRLALLIGHYRQQLNFTFKGLDDAKSALAKLDKHSLAMLEKIPLTKKQFCEILAKKDFGEETGAFIPAYNAMCDDLNVPKAMGEAFTAFQKLENPTLQDAKSYARFLYCVGIVPFETLEKQVVDVPENIKELAQKRWDAKKAKDFALADSLRKEISALGWSVLDKKDGFEIVKE